MGTFVKHMVMCHANNTTVLRSDRQGGRLRVRSSSSSPSPSSDEERPRTRRWTIASTFLAASAAAGLAAAPQQQQQQLALAGESWGVRSYVKEKYFQPEISPEDSAARIRQTAEGLREMRHMLETMSWRYVLFYIRFKMAYLSTDLKNAMATLPQARRKSYVKTANELVENMTELDRYVRTPKVYESYLYYEKTLKSLDDLVAQLA